MSSKTVGNVIFTISKHKNAFDQSLSSSQLLQALWKPPSKSEVNSMRTLPMEMRPKVDLQKEIAKNSGKEGLSLKLAQTFGYAKELVKFYKHGVKLVWDNYKDLRKMKKSDYKVTNQMNNAGKTIDITVPSFSVLTKEMSQALYNAFVENRTSLENSAGDVVRHDKAPTATNYKSNLFNLPRSDYLLLKRTPVDFIKIPTFSVIFIIFMEMTPLLCYAFPEITPLTCVLPSILPRLWLPKKSERMLNSVPKDANVEDFAAKTAYNLSVDQVRALADALRLKTKYIPTALFPVLVLRNRLQAHYNYLKVDNYYLSGLNGNGNVWDLTKAELLRACLERGMIHNIKKFTDLEESSQSDKAEVLAHELDLLRLQLIQFIMNFEKYNIGYLFLSQLVEKPDSTALLWRKNLANM